MPSSQPPWLRNGEFLLPTKAHIFQVYLCLLVSTKIFADKWICNFCRPDSLLDTKSTVVKHKRKSFQVTRDLSSNYRNHVIIYNNLLYTKWPSEDCILVASCSEVASAYIHTAQQVSLIFTALHCMQRGPSDRKSVRLSVRPSVRPSVTA